ncbi:MAG: hypothetical protein AB1529_04280 [Candidatus Micrarchaeota archaeon]
MATLEGLEAEIAAIKQRNARVEADKAWETSLARKAIIAAGTYSFSALLLLSINAENALLAALVPSAGFILSTLTLPVLKGWWLAGRKSR